MTESTHTQPSGDPTGDRAVDAGPDDMPTAEEEQAAERAAASAPDVSADYEQAMKTGAEAQGEGRVDS